MKDTKIKTFTGRIVDPLNISPEDISIEDIAHSLSRQCRFGGHVSGFYSVAQHSVLVMNLVINCTDNIESIKQALMHDATEAYFCDIPKPVKHSHLLHDIIEKIETDIWKAIQVKFNLQEKFDPLVKEADTQALKSEFLSFFNTGTDGTDHAPDDTTTFLGSCWSHDEAEEKFLTAYKSLFICNEIPKC